MNHLLLAGLVGLALAPSARAADLIADGTFNAGTQQWWSSENLTLKVTDGALCAAVPGGTTNAWDATIGQDDVALKEGEAYSFSFHASGTPKGPVRALVQMNATPWTAYVETAQLTGPDGADYAVTFRASISNPAAQVVFQVGGSPEPWTICLDDIHLIDGAEITAYQPDTGPVIRVNQLGYLPDGPKHATIVADDAAPFEWSLLDADNKIVLQGMSVPLGNDASSGLVVHLADFTAADGAGDGYRISAKGDRSHPFAIRDGLYAGLASDALAYFYPVRSGIAIEGTLAGADYARPAGHIGVAPNQGDTDVGCQSPEASQAVYGEAWTCSYRLDASGGWYDAGDQGKYVVNGGIAVAQLLSAYERDPDAFADGALAIPEAGNGVPDILDEARWELDWMLKMIVPDGQPMAGMVHHQLDDDAQAGMPLLPHLDDQHRALHRPSTAATLNLAAVAAQGARLFRGFDKTYADRLLAVARLTYAAALAHPAVYAPAAGGGAGGGSYDDDVVTDEFYWAAVELYLTTGDAALLPAIEANEPPTEVLFGAGAFDWQNVGTLPFMHLLTIDSAYPLPLRDSMRYELLAAADRYVAEQGVQAFGQMYAPEGGDYVWGSNHLGLQNALVVATAWDITGDAEYRDAVLQAADYILGRNALNLSYVTGYGTVFAQNQHSSWFAHALDPDLPHPPKGALAGGPNSGLQDPTAQRLLTGCKPQFCYVDDIQSWSTNEIAINWNAALVQFAAVLAGM